MSSDESHVDPVVATESARAEAMREYTALGIAPSEWSNGPGARYGRHDHSYRKILYCLQGSITFHLSAGDVAMRAGDRLDLPAYTDHAATVGPDGVVCVEGAVG